MAPLSLKIILEEGAVCRTILFSTNTTVREAHDIVLEKFHNSLNQEKAYGLFLTSVDDEKSGIWLESHRALDYYMLRDGDSLQYLCKTRNLRIRMLDGSVKTLQVDESKVVGELLFLICSKIGITNHDEYGFCRDENMEPEETKAATGTLTLKRKIQKDKDVKLEQLSKKLNTDDNVEWLNQMNTLRELKVDATETLLLKRRLFYSDRKIDARDPVQLNLLYVQTRDNILSGRQVTTEEKAIEFAGIQCQVHFGDFEEDKHKPGFIENLAEYLPKAYVSSWGIEKKIYREYRKHIGVSQLDAKYLYTKIAREHPTYGVTFFLVKEQEKGKKKMVPRLLGINANSILRLDENTKEILKVWLLTQVKSYHAGKSTFTLNFGDYSDKEYAVKTNEAYRIRDILEGYIDIIRKRVAGPFNKSYVEGQVICEDNVEKSKGTLIQTVVPQKLVEHSFVGPSKIISHEIGQEARQGTQIVTVQRMLVTRKGDMKQQAMSGIAGCMPVDFTRRINHLNSQSVKAVMLLGDPSRGNLDQVRTIGDDFEAEIPAIVKGAEELAKLQTSEEDKKKLLDDLEQIRKYLLEFSSSTKSNDLAAPDNIEKVEETAKKIAELSSLIILSSDPKIKRRSQLLRSSRKSFIEDERIEATLRRASFLTLASSTSKAVEQAVDDLHKPYSGPSINNVDAVNLKSSAADKLAKLNAAVALLLAARADPKKVDYETAVNSMTTINELTPSLIKDAKALSSIQDGGKHLDLLNQINALCQSLNTMCNLSGLNEESELQDAANKYAKTSGKLIYIFKPKSYGSHSHNTSDVDKGNEIIELAKEVRDRTNNTLSMTSDLAKEDCNDTSAQALNDVGGKCADAAIGLLVCSEITAPTIHEPHCQSALTAAVENFSSSLQQLNSTWKPLVEGQKYQKYGKPIDEETSKLTKTLERLKKAYENLDAGDGKPKVQPKPVPKEKNMKRLQFLTNLSAAKHSVEEMERELQDAKKNLYEKPIIDADNKKKLRQLLLQKIAQMNAAVASLVHATCDRESPDYETAVVAIDTINELNPQIIKDTKDLCRYENDKTRNDLLEEIAVLCKATHGVCVSAEKNNPQDMYDAASNFADSSGKLCYVFNPRANPEKENQILDLSRCSCEKASEMLSKVYQLTEAIGGEDGSKLDSSGTRVVSAAQGLLIVAQITAPSIRDERCQSALITSANRVSNLTQDVASLWEPLIRNPEYHTLGDQLNKDREILETLLEKLKKACESELEVVEGIDDPKRKEKQRLTFVITTTAAKNNLAEAEKLLQNSKDIVIPQKLSKDTPAYKDLEGLTAQKLAELNAAVAALMRAVSDASNIDYETAESAVTVISKLTPDIILNTNKLCHYVDEKQRLAMLDNVMSLCKANKLICDSLDKNDMQELNNAANKYVNSSGKLCYIFNPRANSMKENQLLDLSREACENTSLMLSRVYELAEKVGGEEGSRLDTSGAKVVDAAQVLLSTAQITAVSISDPRCQSELIKSADTVSSLTQDLASIWEPIIQNPDHEALGDQIVVDRKNLEQSLNKLKNACRFKKDKAENIENVKDKQRLQFVQTASGAKKKISEAEKYVKDNSNIIAQAKKLNKNTRQYEVLQCLSAQKLAELNAAVAAVMQATSDSVSPDYKKAETALSAVSQLTPEIVQNICKLCEYEVDEQCQAMLEHLKTLCAANQRLCDSLEKNDVKNLFAAADNFAKSSGKLYYVIDPRGVSSVENQIIDLSRSACQKASEILPKVHQLSEAVGGKDGSKLDSFGTRVMSGTQGLRAVAQITAPSIRDERCKSALITSANTVSNLTQDVASFWDPILQNPKYHALGDQLSKDTKSLETLLEKLKKACKTEFEEVEGIGDQKNREQQRVTFVMTTTAAKKKLEETEKLLQNSGDTVIPQKLDKDTPVYRDLQRLTAQKLAELNAAIAALMRATLDTSNIDYKAAESAVTVISKLTPDIILNTNKLCQYEDEKQRLAMLDNLRSLYKANKLICDSLDKNDLQELNSAANNFVNSSGKLFYTFNPLANSMKEDQILDLSREACENTSLMLSRVYELAEKVGGEEGSRLDTSGAKVVDAAQVLLSTAQITAASISDPRCQSELIKSADTVSSLTQDLASIWEPIIENPDHRVLGDQIVVDRRNVEEILDKLKNACRCDNDKAENVDNVTKKQRLKCIQSALETKKTISEAEKYLQDNSNILVRTEKLDKNTPEYKELQHLSAQKMAELNAAIAAVVQATSDSVEPDYKRAEAALLAILQLTPEIVQNTSQLCQYEGEKHRHAMLDQARALCAVNQLVCDSLEKNDVKDMITIADKFASSSGKLYYVFDPHAVTLVKDQIVELSKSARAKTSDILSSVKNLSENIGEEEARNLKNTGTRLVDAADILFATAQITAPSIADSRCQSELMTSTDLVSKLVGDLASKWEPLIWTSPLAVNQPLGDKLKEDRKILEATLRKLRTASNPQSDLVKLLVTMSGAKEKLVEVEKLLEENDPSIVATDEHNEENPEYKKLQRVLAQKLAELNASMANLVRANSDSRHPDYETTETEILKISQLTPEIFQYTKKLSKYIEPKQGQEMLDNVNEICKTNKLLYDSLEKGDNEGLTNAASKFANCSGKLYHVFNPPSADKSTKENLLLGLSKAVYEKVSGMLYLVDNLSESVGGEDASQVDTIAGRVADTARELRVVTQITTPSIEYGKCETMVVASAKKLSSHAEDLCSKWTPIVQNSNYTVIGEKLSKEKKELDGLVEKLIAECRVKSGKLSKPDPPVRQTTTSSNEDKLKTKHVHFCKSAELAQSCIKKAEEDLKKPINTKSTGPLIVGAQEKLQNLIVNNLASAGVAVSHMISDMGPDHVNYDNAIKATKVLSELIPVIVKDGKVLSSTREDTARQEFLTDMLSLCEVSTKLCDSAKNNSKNVNNIAIEFGNMAAKLVYNVSAEVHPNQEKEVIRRAREIGDSTSRLAIRGAEGALEVKDAWAHALSAAATRCADSASNFMYTAKLVAPTIHCPESRKALLEVSNELTSKFKEYSLAWQPLYSNKAYSAFVKDLDSESELLRHLLENFNQDLMNDKLVKRRVVEKLVVQDTPLRQLASKILETVKTKAEFSDSSEEKRNLLDYTNKLAAAIKDMDIANSKSRNAPHDIRRREELEEAVQHLQQICLESRIQSGQEKRFVDLMDLINDVSSDAKILAEETIKIKPEFNKYALITIKSQADDIIKAATETAHPPDMDNDGEVIDGTLIIKEFAQKTDERVDIMRVAIEEIRDVPSQKILQSKLINLSGSSDLLRFAVNSHIAAVRTATLDANQADFEVLEKNIDNFLQSTRKRKNPKTGTATLSAGLATATTLCSAVSSQSATEKIPPALTSYLLEMRSGSNLADSKEKFRLEEHLKKLLGLLKTHTIAKSRQIATWQENDTGEINEITCQIIQEIEKYNNEGNDGVQKRTAGEVLNQNDLRLLLLPSTETIYGDSKQLNNKFHQQLENLSTLTGMVQLEFSRSEPLNSLHKVAGVAMELRAVARAVATADPMKRPRVEDATDAMCSTTYHYLKTAEAASKDRHNPDSLRRFNEARRLMNEALTKLGQLNKSKDKLKSDSAEIARNLQLQMSLLQTDYPSNMMAYATCLEPLQNQNNLQSIQNEDPMTRGECCANLEYLSSMMCHSSELAAQCGYLLSLPDEYQHIAKYGFINVSRIMNITNELRLACLKIIHSTNIEEANYIQSNINKQVIELQEVLQEAVAKLKDPQVRQEVMRSIEEVDQAIKNLRDTLRESPDMKTVTPLATNILDATEDLASAISPLAVLPQVQRYGDRKVRSEEVISNTKTLLIKTQDLVNTVASSDFEVLTWKMFESHRNQLINSYEQFVNCIAENGQRAGFIEGKAELVKPTNTENVNEPKKAFVEIQYDLARKWLNKPASKPDDKSAGIQGVKNIIELAEKMSEDMTGDEKCDMQGMIDETKSLVDECTKKYNSDKAGLLLERLRELKSMLKWRVVTRVVEDFLEEEPLTDLDLLTEGETNDQKRKFILDKKVAELLAQLGRMTKTARFVADAGSGSSDRELLQAKDQMELLAPALVKAAQHRIENPNNKEAVETYKRFLMQYSELMSKLREICDRSVDPMEFAQAAGETIQRIREESTVKSDPQTCANTSRAITRLGRRVIEAGLNSQEAQSDPELRQALAQAQGRLAASTKVQQRSSRAPDWRDITAEILRTTGEVESFLGGENIFQKQPEPDQPIYAAALDLHATVREWSARDNEIVAVAKRMAVQMAKLSDYMNTDRKYELLNTSKNIVASSHQVAALARKLALECTDMRIRTNLMQVCEQIPTISGQLKMLIAVKGSSMGGQGMQESREAMDTLVSNAKNLMASIQEVVKAAIGASVKIMSQRGLRMKWVRRACYNY